MAEQRLIIVAVADVRTAAATLRWAVDDAVADPAWIRIVHAFEPEPGGFWTPRLRVPSVAVAEQRRAEAETVVSQAVKLSRQLAPGVVVHGEAIEGPATTVLLDEAQSADLLVLGSRHLPGLARYFVGSVGQTVAERAGCPVAVIRSETSQADTKLVLGLDVAQDCEPLLAFAFNLASRTGLPIEAVYCWLPPIGTALEALANYQDEDRERVEAELDDALAPWRRKYPQVPVSAEVSPHWPVPELLERAHPSNPLIIGRHHRHNLPALGSVHLGALHHAEGPLIIIPVSRDRR